MFQGQNYEATISRKRSELAQKCLILFFINADIYHRMASLKMFSRWPWHILSRKKIRNDNILNGESYSKYAFDDLYTCWYSPSNGNIAFIVLHDLDLNFSGRVLSPWVVGPWIHLQAHYTSHLSVELGTHVDLRWLRKPSDGRHKQLAATFNYPLKHRDKQASYQYEVALLPGNSQLEKLRTHRSRKTMRQSSVLNRFVFIQLFLPNSTFILTESI